jgi:hypothetical protein
VRHRILFLYLLFHPSCPFAFFVVQPV